MVGKFTMLLFFCFSINTLFSQQGAPKGLIKSINKTDEVRGKTFALIFGISEYQHVQDLQFADDDANAFASYLESTIQKDSLVVLKFIDTTATIGNFFPSLWKIIQAADSLDRVFIFFSGHGDSENDIDLDAYLLTHNSPKNNYAYGAISIGFLQNHIDQLTKKGCEVVVIVDACRSGLLPKKIGNLRQKLVLALNQHYKEIKILSCEPGEESIENSKIGGGRGLFSFILESGLSGQADLDEDNKITLREIGAFLNDNVPDLAKSLQNHEQHPEVKGDNKKVIVKLREREPLEISSIADSVSALLYSKHPIPIKSFSRDAKKNIPLNFKESKELDELYQKPEKAPKDSLSKGQINLFGAYIDSIQDEFNLYLASQEFNEDNYDPKRILSLLEKAILTCPIQQKAFIDELKGKRDLFKAVHSIEKEVSPFQITSLFLNAKNLLKNGAFVYFEICKYYHRLGFDAIALEHFNQAKKLAPSWEIDFPKTTPDLFPSYTVTIIESQALNLRIKKSELVDFDIKVQFYKKNRLPKWLRFSSSEYIKVKNIYKQNWSKAEIEISNVRDQKNSKFTTDGGLFIFKIREKGSNRILSALESNPSFPNSKNSVEGVKFEMHESGVKLDFLNYEKKKKNEIYMLEVYLKKGESEILVYSLELENTHKERKHDHSIID